MSNKKHKKAHKAPEQAESEALVYNNVMDWLIHGGEAPLPLWPEIK